MMKKIVAECFANVSGKKKMTVYHKGFRLCKNWELLWNNFWGIISLFLWLFIIHPHFHLVEHLVPTVNILLSLHIHRRAHSLWLTDMNTYCNETVISRRAQSEMYPFWLLFLFCSGWRGFWQKKMEDQPLTWFCSLCLPLGDCVCLSVNPRFVPATDRMHRLSVLCVFNARGKCVFMNFLSGRALLSARLIKLAPNWEERQTRRKRKDRAVEDKICGRQRGEGGRQIEVLPYQQVAGRGWTKGIIPHKDNEARRLKRLLG